MSEERSPDFVSEKELCRRLNISRSTARRHLRAFAFAFGTSVRYDLAAILRYTRLTPDDEGDR